MENEKLEYPLTDNLIKFINEQRPIEGAFIVSIIESLFQKNNSNKFCYKNDLIKKLIPLLGNQAEDFVNRLFKNISQPIKHEKKVTFKTENVFKKIKSNDNKKVDVDNKLSSDFIGYGNFFTFETSTTAATTENNTDNKLAKEVILNKVNDKKYSPNEIKQFCAKFGKIDAFRKLNREKWLVTFTDYKSAANLVKTTEFVCGDSEIKKYFNVFAPEFVKTTQIDGFLKTDLHSLLLQQQDLFDKISHTQNFDDFIVLKNITDTIRQIIFSDDNYKNYNKKHDKTSYKTISKSHLKKISKLNNKHNKIEEIDSIFTQYFT